MIDTAVVNEVLLRDVVLRDAAARQGERHLRVAHRHYDHVAAADGVVDVPVAAENDAHVGVELARIIEGLRNGVLEIVEYVRDVRLGDAVHLKDFAQNGIDVAAGNASREAGNALRKADDFGGKDTRLSRLDENALRHVPFGVDLDGDALDLAAAPEGIDVVEIIVAQHVRLRDDDEKGLAPRQDGHIPSHDGGKIVARIDGNDDRVVTGIAEPLIDTDLVRIEVHRHAADVR